MKKLTSDTTVNGFYCAKVEVLAADVYARDLPQAKKHRRLVLPWFVGVFAVVVIGSYFPTLGGWWFAVYISAIPVALTMLAIGYSHSRRSDVIVRSASDFAAKGEFLHPPKISRSRFWRFLFVTYDAITVRALHHRRPELQRAYEELLTIPFHELVDFYRNDVNRKVRQAG